MGGVIILAAVTIASLLYLRNYPKIIPVLFATLGFGLIGFLDDYIKVVMKRSMGLRAWQKMVGEILVTSILYVYIDRPGSPTPFHIQLLSETAASCAPYLL